MGNPTTKETGHRFGIQGPRTNPDPHVARQSALRENVDFGVIALINAGAGGDPNAPTAPWGRDDSLGNDPMSARGNMWGDAIGDSFGAAGADRRLPHNQPTTGYRLLGAYRRFGRQ